MKITTLQAKPEIQLHSSSNDAATSRPTISFDDVFQAATTIYAVPESNPTGNQNLSLNSASDFTVSEQMEAIFQTAADTYQVPLNLLKAVAKAESDFDPNCTSNAGAMGIMQLMPSTASALNVTDPYDAEQNIMGGAKLLSQLLKKYDGNLPFALAAYNAGSGNVDKYNGIPPFRETQNYVKKIMGYLNQEITIPKSATEHADVTISATASSLPAGSVLIHAQPMSD